MPRQSGKNSNQFSQKQIWGGSMLYPENTENACAYDRVDSIFIDSNISSFLFCVMGGQLDIICCKKLSEGLCKL